MGLSTNNSHGSAGLFRLKGLNRANDATLRFKALEVWPEVGGGERDPTREPCGEPHRSIARVQLRSVTHAVSGQAPSAVIFLPQSNGAFPPPHCIRNCTTLSRLARSLPLSLRAFSLIAALSFSTGSSRGSALPVEKSNLPHR